MNPYRSVLRWLARDEIEQAMRLLPELQQQAYEAGFAHGQKFIFDQVSRLGSRGLEVLPGGEIVPRERVVH